MWIDVVYDNMNALQCSSCGSVLFWENGVDIRQDECPECQCEMRLFYEEKNS